jgi:6-phosphofructokinase
VAAKGNLAVGQSGGPTAVINCSLAGILAEALAQEARVGEIYGLVHGIEGALRGELVDLRRRPPEFLAHLCQTPAAVLGSCRYKLRPEEYLQVLETLRAHNVRYFLYIGGNDSMDTSQHIAEAAQAAGYELFVVGVPKTVDNDLPCTDHTPGYGSIARYWALHAMEAARDLEAMRRYDQVKILETMGRNAGWVAASTALGRCLPDDPPHLIYVPERPFDQERFLSDVEEVYRRHGYVLVTVAETIRDGTGRPIGRAEGAFARDAFGHAVLEGTAQTLCRLVEQHLKLKARFNKPGTAQRVAAHCASEVDRREAYEAGRAAVRLAVSGQSRVMVTLVRESDEPYRCTTGVAPLQAVANAERRLPDEFIAPAGNNVTEAFLRYARPLIGAPLPVHAHLWRPG